MIPVIHDRMLSTKLQLAVEQVDYMQGEIA